MTVLHTARLRLEPMAGAHFAGLQALNADPIVMRYITGRPETPDETRAMIARQQARWASLGFGWWALLDAGGDIVGASGVNRLDGDPAQPFEVGWRLRPDRWGQGLATEAARAALDFVFDTLDAPLACAIRHPDNEASRRVMERLGMRHVGEHGEHALHELARADRAARAG